MNSNRQPRPAGISEHLAQRLSEADERPLTADEEAAADVAIASAREALRAAALAKMAASKPLTAPRLPRRARAHNARVVRKAVR